MGGIAIVSAGVFLNPIVPPPGPDRFPLAESNLLYAQYGGTLKASLMNYGEGGIEGGYAVGAPVINADGFTSAPGSSINYDVIDPAVPAFTLAVAIHRLDGTGYFATIAIEGAVDANRDAIVSAATSSVGAVINAIQAGAKTVVAGEKALLILSYDGVSAIRYKKYNHTGTGGVLSTYATTAQVMSPATRLIIGMGTTSSGSSIAQKVYAAAYWKAYMTESQMDAAALVMLGDLTSRGITL